jgi:hypothetical protein
VLVIFGGDVLFDSFREGGIMGAAEWEIEDIVPVEMLALRLS